jgi:hypothetical protein
MQSFQEHFEDTQFLHQFESGRMDGVPTEVAQEVGMLLENHDIDSRACEQKSKHHAGWTAAYDTAAGLKFF